MPTLGRITEFWRRRSLRFWLAMGMVMACCPIFASAVAGYLLYHQQIIQPLVDASTKQRQVLQPLQSVQEALWDVERSLVNYVIDGKTERVASYRQAAGKIEADLAGLSAAFETHGIDAPAVGGVREGWRELAAASGKLLSDGPLGGKREVGRHAEEVEAKMNRLGHLLNTPYADVRADNERTHRRALVALVRVEKMALGAFGASVLFAFLGVLVINRSLVNSMDELATGALRVAQGDRNHRVEVKIPHELASVADAFNQMTNQILRQEEVLEKAATTDGLTGLLNRREFDRLLAEEVRRAKRYRLPLSLIFADIDHFKRFNDTYGHQAGDDALRSVAKALMESVREVDKVCRYGGEEFVVLLTECDGETAQRKAEQLRATIASRGLQVEGPGSVHVTISQGVATYPDSGVTPVALLKMADEALYRSKLEGRNRVTSASLETVLQECETSFDAPYSPV